MMERRVKRSQTIDLGRMRKQFLPATKPLSVAIAAASLAGCSDDQEVFVISSVYDCINQTNWDMATCEAAYQKAMEESEYSEPRFATRQDCEAEFGFNSCNEEFNGYSPDMVGFLVEEGIDEVGDLIAYNTLYRYKGRHKSLRGYVLADGTPVLNQRGRYFVNKKALLTPKIRKANTKTLSRGGFGRQAVAKVAAARSASRSWGG